LKYTIKRQIGSSSFGTIYEILLKIDIVSKERFEREVQTLSELDHPNIVKIFYWNVGGDPPMFAPNYIMEYLTANSLNEHADILWTRGILIT
jgi:serine/threonine protein kinase